MKTFRIELTASALLDIDDALSFYKSHSFNGASIWQRKLISTIQNLETMPGRHALLFETGAHRMTTCFDHQIIYRVDESAGLVYVVRVFHSARRPLDLTDLELE